MADETTGKPRSRRKPPGADLALAAVAAQAETANGTPDELRWAEGVRRLRRAWRIFLLARREAGAGLALIFVAGCDGAFARRLRWAAGAVREGLWIGLQAGAFVLRIIVMLPVRFVMWWVDRRGLTIAVLVIGALGWLTFRFEAVRAPLFWLAAVVVAGFLALVGLQSLGDREFKRQAASATTPAQRRDRQSLGMGDLAGYGIVALARYALMAVAAGALVFAMVQAAQRPAASGVAVLVGLGAVSLLLLPVAFAAFARERARRRLAEAYARAYRGIDAVKPRPAAPGVEAVLTPSPPPPVAPAPPQPVAAAPAARATEAAARARMSASPDETQIEAKWAARGGIRGAFEIGALWDDLAPVLIALAACAIVGVLVLQFGPWGLLWLALSAALIFAVRRSAPMDPDNVESTPAGGRDVLRDVASIVWLGVAGGVALGLGLAAAIISAPTVLLAAVIAALAIFFRFTIGALVARTITLVIAALSRVRAPEWRSRLERRLRAIATPLVVVACFALIALVAVKAPRIQPAPKVETPKRAAAGSPAKPGLRPTPPPAITLAAGSARTPIAFAFGYRDRLEGAGANSVALKDLAIDGVCGRAILYAVGATSVAGSSQANFALAQRRAMALGRHLAERVKACAPPRAAIVAVALAPAQGTDDRAQRAPIVATEISAAAMDGRSAARMCLIAPGGSAAPTGPNPCPKWAPIPSDAQ